MARTFFDIIKIMTPQLYILSRKIHRFMVIIIVVISLTMMITGLNMKYGWFWLDPLFARDLHNLLSPYFAIVLLINVITGFYMYLYTQPRGGKPSQS